MDSFPQSIVLHKCVIVDNTQQQHTVYVNVYMYVYIIQWMHYAMQARLGTHCMLLPVFVYGISRNQARPRLFKLPL